MARTDPQLNLRLPAELKTKLEQAAGSNNRTVTAETVQRLDASFSNDVVGASLAALAYRIAQLEFELQSKQLDIAELANSLSSAVDEIKEGLGVEDIDTPPHIKKWQDLVAKFNLSVSELQKLGRLTDERFDALTAAAAQMHRTPSKKTS